MHKCKRQILKLTMPLQSAMNNTCFFSPKPFTFLSFKTLTTFTSPSSVALFWDLKSLPPTTTYRRLSLYDTAVRLRLAAASFGLLLSPSLAFSPGHRLPPLPPLQPPFPCRMCSRAFPSHQTLTHHFTSVHSPQYERRLKRLESATGRRRCILYGQVSVNLSRYEKAHRELFERCENSIDEVKRAGFRVLVGGDEIVHVCRELEAWPQRVFCVVIVSDDFEFVRVLGEMRQKGVKCAVIGELKGDNGLKRHADVGFCWREVLAGKVKVEGPKVVAQWKENDLLERLEWRHDPSRDDKEKVFTLDTGEEKAKAEPWWKLGSDFSKKKWRVFVIPFLARGHLIPMTDFARLLSASHPDIEPTMVVTPGNTMFVTSSLGKSNTSTLQPVKVLTYPFPSIGVTANVETVGMGSSAESSVLDQGYYVVRPGQEQLLQQYKPDVVIADAKFPWIAAIADDLRIPCIFFMCSGAFPLLLYNCLSRMRLNVGLHDQVTISGLAGPEIQMPVLELPPLVLPEEVDCARHVESVIKSWVGAFGIVFNTFRGLESEYCNQFEMTQATRSYFVGPISLSHSTDMHCVVERGGEGDTSCLRWLDNKAKQSVIFVSFGSQCYFKSAQLHEIAVGLEESRQNFLWVVRGVDQSAEWMPEGWEEKVADRGLVVKGWAPQVAILAHAAIGAFVTHCGWNSILEGSAAGVPMLTWPLANDQFSNEKLLVDVVGCAVRLWEGGKRSSREPESQLVPRAVIAHSLSKFMEPEGEYSSVHCKARELGAVAWAAMAEGGSSMGDLGRLINDLIDVMQSKRANKNFQ